MNQPDLLRRLTRLDAAALCDADKGIRVLDSGIRLVNSVPQMVGRAHTVRCRDDFLTVLQGLHDAHPGDVLVVDAGGGPRAMAGELFASEASRKGLAGIVIDGACRDTARLATIPLPVYARSVSPMAGTVGRLFETAVPVTCGGVEVHPGDWLIGDRDGIVVIGENELEKLLDRAAAIQATEGRALQQLERGESLFDLLNFADHADAVRQGRPSQLRFKS